MLRRPLITSAGFAAAISLGEFGATTFLTRSGDETMPVAVARLLGRAGDVPHAQGSAMAVILAAVTLAILIAVDAIDRDAIDRQDTDRDRVARNRAERHQRSTGLRAGRV